MSSLFRDESDRLLSYASKHKEESAHKRIDEQELGHQTSPHEMLTGWLWLWGRGRLWASADCAAAAWLSSAPMHVVFASEWISHNRSNVRFDPRTRPRPMT